MVPKASAEPWPVWCLATMEISRFLGRRQQVKWCLRFCNPPADRYPTDVCCYLSWAEPCTGLWDPGDQPWGYEQVVGEEGPDSVTGVQGLGSSIEVSKSHWKSARLSREGDVLNWALKVE